MVRQCINSGTLQGTSLYECYGQRAVGDILKVTQLIQKEYPAVQVENLGETDFIIEYVQERKKDLCGSILR